MHFSTRSFPRNQSVAPLTPLTLRKVRDSTHQLLERKPILLLEHLLLYTYIYICVCVYYPKLHIYQDIYIILKGTWSHLYMPLLDFPVFGESILPLLGQDLKRRDSHFMKHGLFCFLPLTPGSSASLLPSRDLVSGQHVI